MKRWLIKAPSALLFCLMSLPLCLLLGCLAAPDAPILWYAAPLSGVLCALCLYPLSGRLRARAFTASLIAVGLLWCVLTYLLASPLCMLMALPAVVTGALLMPRLLLTAGDELTGKHDLFGVLSYLAALLLAAVTDVFTAVTAHCTVLFPIYCVLLLFSLNSRTVRSDALQHGAPNRVVIRRNRVMVLFVAALALLIANLRAVGDTLTAVWHAVWKAIGAFLEFLGSLLVTNETAAGGGEGGGMDLSGLGDSSEPSALAKLLEKILIYIALALAAAALCALLYFIGKRLAVLLRRLADRLRQYYGRVGTAYQDTVESLFSWREMRARMQDSPLLSRKKRDKLPPWEKLDARGRVRRAYLLFIRKHGGADSAMTARQVLRKTLKDTAGADGAGALYDRARYSQGDISPEEAERMRTALLAAGEKR